MALSTAKFTDSEMFKEADRLKTFGNWPVSSISKNTMAAAGFYFLGRQDWVRCPFCGVQIGDWGLGDDPLSCHKRWSRGLYTRNVPIGSDPQ
jgi:hypothetical protein